MEQKLGSHSQFLGSYAVSAVRGVLWCPGIGRGGVVVVLLVVPHHCHWVMVGQMCCGELAKMAGVLNLRVVLGGVLLGEGGGLLVDSSIVRFMLRVSSCGENRIGQCVLWECHKKGVVGFRP